MSSDPLVWGDLRLGQLLDRQEPQGPLHQFLASPGKDRNGPAALWILDGGRLNRDPVPFVLNRECRGFRLKVLSSSGPAEGVLRDCVEEIQGSGISSVSRVPRSQELQLLGFDRWRHRRARSWSGIAG